jgi:hypothetical protein
LARRADIGAGIAGTPDGALQFGIDRHRQLGMAQRVADLAHAELGPAPLHQLAGALGHVQRLGPQLQRGGVVGARVVHPADQHHQLGLVVEPACAAAALERLVQPVQAFVGVPALVDDQREGLGQQHERRIVVQHRRLLQRQHALVEQGRTAPVVAVLAQPLDLRAQFRACLARMKHGAWAPRGGAGTVPGMLRETRTKKIRGHCPREPPICRRAARGGPRSWIWMGAPPAGAERWQRDPDGQNS